MKYNFVIILIIYLMIYSPVKSMENDCKQFKKFSAKYIECSAKKIKKKTDKKFKSSKEKIEKSVIKDKLKKFKDSKTLSEVVKD